MAGERSERDHVYQHHLLVASCIRSHKRTNVAQSSVVDQEIDIDFFAIEPGH